jgi:hypothetical protein
VFRGQDRSEWDLLTSLEREFDIPRAVIERRTLMQFVRTAPRFFASHLVPADDDVAAWLGLIQHYGGPTRLLDVTLSPYVALFFAFEASGEHERAVWAIDVGWCQEACTQIMARSEGKPRNEVVDRVEQAQAELVFSLVYGRPHRSERFKSFKPFTGAFAVEPWKPDSRQIAQQAMFLCAANVELSFRRNLQEHGEAGKAVMLKFILPASLREEIIDNLAMMNVTAATLFPDLGGLARSLRTFTIRRPFEPS